MEEKRKVPAHIAIIMDGNGRWAKRRGLPRTAGHKKGAEVVERILEDADALGVKYLTVYAFSTENWQRPALEVKTLMNLLRAYMISSKEKCAKNNVCVRVIGAKEALDPDLQAAIADLEEATKENTGIHFQIAINYGGRDEILRSFRRIVQEKAGAVSEGDITGEALEAHLDTAGIPDPDLVIRTCGEQRISNFLMWQCAYSEFYFTPVPWPDFTKEELEKAIDAYGNRERRYGGLLPETDNGSE